jgi:hypothetical protein
VVSAGELGSFSSAAHGCVRASRLAAYFGVVQIYGRDVFFLLLACASRVPGALAVGGGLGKLGRCVRCALQWFVSLCVRRGCLLDIVGGTWLPAIAFQYG